MNIPSYAPNGPRTKDLDYNKIGTLLHIVDLSNPVSRPSLKAIHDVALGELEDMNVDAQAVLKAWAEEAAAAKTKEDADRAEAAAKLKAQEDEAVATSRPRSIPSDQPLERRA